MAWHRGQIMRIHSGAPLAGPSSSPVRRPDRKDSARPDSIARSPDSAAIMGVPADELTENVERALMSLMGEVDQLKQEADTLRAKMRDLEALADHDPLLPVLNRRAFTREAGKALALANRHGAVSTVIYFDLNGFKAINDAHGHAAGDAALHAVASLLVGHLRESDTVGRMGGDEFAVLLALTEFGPGQAKAAALAELIAQTPIPYEGEALRLSAAWGACALEPGLNIEDALARADAAMYARKGGA